MEKYGFVYIWRDKKRKMYYIGVHWGTENDGYICSSNRMRNVYKRRPTDFKRRVLARIYTNRADMFLVEDHWLKKAATRKYRYYNLNFTAKDHWSSSPTKYKSAVDKMKAKQRAYIDSLTEEERKAKFGYWKDRKHPESAKAKKRGRSPWNKGKVGKPWSEETRQKMKNRPPAWNKNKTGVYSEFTRIRMGAGTRGKKLGPRPDDVKEKVGAKNKVHMLEKWQGEEYRKMQSKSHAGYVMPQSQKDAIAASNKGKKKSPRTLEHTENQRKAQSGIGWWTDGVMNIRSRTCPGDTWCKGRTLQPYKKAA